MTGGMVATKVTPMLTDKKLVEAILRCSPFNTGELESFHSMLHRKCPKSFSFSHIRMTSRLVFIIKIIVLVYRI